MAFTPGLPQTSGGNDPVRAAAQSRLAVGGRATDPSQLPQRGPQQGQASQLGGGGQSQVAPLLAQAFEAFVSGGFNEADKEAILDFLESIKGLSPDSQTPQAPLLGGTGAAAPGAGSGPLPGQVAQAAPQPR